VFVARYAIRWSRDASVDVDAFAKAPRTLVKREVSRYLQDQPVPEPGREGQRKAMDLNPLGVEYRLQLGPYRIYYNVDE
jgi:mRNA-degrading endonuclease RelE of RelBE toxin-antitoxin system